MKEITPPIGPEFPTIAKVMRNRGRQKTTVTDSDIEAGNGRGGERRIERIPEMSLPKSLSVYWRNGVNVLWGDIQRASDIILARLGFEIS